MEKFARLKDGRTIYVDYDKKNNPTFYVENSIDDVLDILLSDHVEMYEKALLLLKDSFERQMLRDEELRVLNIIRSAKYIVL